MPITFKCLVWTVLITLLPAPADAETISVGQGKEKAKPSPTQPGAPKEPDPEPPKPLLQPRSVHRIDGEDANEPGRMELTLNLQIHTPLINETNFETRFNAWGGGALVSIPLFDISLRAFVHLEVGALGTFSRIDLASGDSFTHGFFDFPVRLRFLYPLTDDTGVPWIGEVFLGPLFRLFEYDESSGQGPVLFNDSGFILPDLGIGISRGLTSHLRARLLLGYQFLALTAEFGF